jgi:hypothetical protein
MIDLAMCSSARAIQPGASATFADGVADMAVLDAVRRAAAKHRAVDIANLQ